MLKKFNLKNLKLLLNNHLLKYINIKKSHYFWWDFILIKLNLFELFLGLDLDNQYKEVDGKSNR